MIRRWPIRIRLTAAFTVLMALVLLGVAMATVTHSRESLDASISESLTYRLRDLQPLATAAAPALSGIDRDTGEQVLDASGHVIASSPEVAGLSLLTAAEVDSARHGLSLADHAAAGNLDRPVRIAAALTGDGSRIAVVAVSLADRDTAVADLRQELELVFPLVLLAAAIGAYLLAAAALRPVERMRARAAVITAEHPEPRLPVPTARDEISRLGTTFNDLLGRLHAALSRERQFVADASHELRTPSTSSLWTRLSRSSRSAGRTPDRASSRSPRSPCSSGSARYAQGQAAESRSSPFSAPLAHFWWTSISTDAMSPWNEIQHYPLPMTQRQ